MPCALPCIYLKQLTHRTSALGAQQNILDECDVNGVKRADGGCGWRPNK